MGRPPKQDGQSKTNRFEVRLNDKQYQLLSDLAEHYGLTKTEVILKALETLAKKTK